MAVAGGFHQLRQGSTVDIVVTGSALAGATAVAVGTLTASIVTATETEVRATVTVPSGFEPRQLTVVVTTANGSASLADALETTFYVIAADASPGGRGTEEQPLALCDLDEFEVRAGDTLSLGTGVHSCDRQFRLNGGVRIVGLGVGTTVIDGLQGLLFDDASDGVVTVLHGFSVRSNTSLAVVRLRPLGGSLEVDGLAIDGQARGIWVEKAAEAVRDRTVAINGFEYHGSGDALALESAATVTHSTITDCATAITYIEDAKLELRGVNVAGCARGLLVKPLINITGRHNPVVEISDASWLGNTVGIEIEDGGITLDRVRIEGSDEHGCTTGAWLKNGRLTVGHSQIRCAQFGIRVLADSTSLLNVQQSVLLDGVEITGAEVGIELDESTRLGAIESSSAVVSHSVLDGSGAAVSLVNPNARVSLDGIEKLGDNQLRGLGTGVAFRDLRRKDGLAGVTFATGTTINGRALSGRVVGPVSQPPDYELVRNTALQF